MEQKFVNLLTLNEYYPVISSITKRPYIDKDYACYLFEVQNEGIAFCNETENVYLDFAKTYKQAEICIGAYSAGIKKIIIVQRDGIKTEIPLSKKDVPRGYYNGKCNYLITKLKETKKKAYLNELKNKTFLTPAMVDPRIEKDYPTIHYCYAYTKGEKRKLYILFSTLDEFNKWNETKGYKKWKPLNVELKTFGRIRRHNPVVINPLSDKLILSNEQITSVLKMEKTK